MISEKRVHRISKAAFLRSRLCLGIVIIMLFPLMGSDIPDSLSYRVQIAARYGVPLSPEAFSELIRKDFEILEGQHMGWYKYTVGYSSTFDSAYDLSRIIAEKYGIVDPFVAKYIYGNRLPIADLYYKVQIAASYKSPVSIWGLKRKFNLKQPVSEEFFAPYYKYLTGSFLNFDEAASYAEELQNVNGVEGAFVVPYYRNKRVTEPDSFAFFVNNEGFFNRLPRIQNGISTAPIEEAIKAMREGLSAPRKRPVAKAVEKEPEKPVEEEVVVEEPVKDTVEEAPVEARDTSVIIPPERKPATGVRPVIQRKDVIREGIRSFINRNFSGNFVLWANKIIDLSYKSVLILVFAIVVIFLLINLVVVFLFIIINKIRREYYSRKVKRYRAEYQEMLTDYLFDEENEENIFRKLRAVKGKFGKQILIEEFLRMYFNVSGDAENKLHNFFYRLNLHKDSMRRLGKHDWVDKSKAIREITMMNVKEAMPYVEKYINSRNDTLRSEAQIAMVRLNEDDPFSFLEKLKEDFTQWEQLNVHAIVRLYDIRIPDFSRWFGSGNDTVVIFAIRMATIYQQTGSFMELLDLTRHKSEKVRKEVIIAIGKMQLREGIPKLMSIYSAETYNNQLQILKALQQIPDESEISFLVEKTRDDDFDIQLNALKVLNNIGYKGQQIMEDMANDRDIAFREKIKHVTDKRI